MTIGCDIKQGSITKHIQGPHMHTHTHKHTVHPYNLSTPLSLCDQIQISHITRTNMSRPESLFFWPKNKHFTPLSWTPQSNCPLLQGPASKHWKRWHRGHLLLSVPKCHPAAGTTYDIHWASSGGCYQSSWSQSAGGGNRDWAAPGICTGSVGPGLGWASCDGLGLMSRGQMYGSVLDRCSNESRSGHIYNNDLVFGTGSVHHGIQAGKGDLGQHSSGLWWQGLLLNTKYVLVTLLTVLHF